MACGQTRRCFAAGCQLTFAAGRIESAFLLRAEDQKESLMRGKILCSFLCCLIWWAPGFGQGQKAADKTYVLKAARLFDGKSNAVVTPGLIIVSGGKITG